MDLQPLLTLKNCSVSYFSTFHSILTVPKRFSNQLDISYEKGRLYTYADCLWKEWAFENDDKKYTLDELYDIWAKFVEPEVAPIHRERKNFFLSLDNDKKMIFIEIDTEMKKEIDCFNFLDL